MTEALRVGPRMKVLEIGTGSGYQAAVLAKLARRVYSVERFKPLSKAAERLLLDLGIYNVVVDINDGSKGWPGQAPFDRIIVTAAAEERPQALIDQLAVGGILIVPVGRDPTSQVVERIVKNESGLQRDTLMPVRFVPLVAGRCRCSGRAERSPPRERQDIASGNVRECRRTNDPGSYSRSNLDELHSGHEKRPSLPLAMGRPDAHAGYNGGAVGRARRLQHRHGCPRRHHGISRVRRRPNAVPVYVVKDKDTVDGLSRRYGVPSQTIIDRNNLKAPYTLKPGQQLAMPGARFVQDTYGEAPARRPRRPIPTRRPR